MLSPRTIEIVKSTAPVLQVHGETITRAFYKRMFANHPELLNIFNHANQRQGKQQAALANAVYAAALHIDNLEPIIPVVKQIAHKHRSLGVTPEQYPIVGTNLLAAIKEVLGDAATDEIIGAWGEAYGVLADAFIAVEKGMYDAAAEVPGGWRGFRPFVVQRKQVESDVITSFYLVPQDGGAISAFQPGQYISVKLDLEGQQFTHIRQYSLSDTPGKPHYRISVKREDAADKKEQGVVSNHLHANVNEGDVLMLSAPAGEFVLDTTSDEPLVLISGGVGLTPLLSMFKTTVELQAGRPVTFIHAALSGSHHALRKEVADLAGENPHTKAYFCYENPSDADRTSGCFHREGRVDLDWLKTVVPVKEAQYYLCGPLPFMKAVYQALRTWGVPVTSIHYEVFGPSASLEG